MCSFHRQFIAIAEVSVLDSCNQLMQDVSVDTMYLEPYLRSALKGSHDVEDIKGSHDVEDSKRSHDVEDLCFAFSSYTYTI